MNNKALSDNNSILFNIIKQLEEIVNDLYNNKKIDLIINQIKNIIILTNKIINDNKNSIDLIRKDIDKMVHKFENIENNISNNNNFKNLNISTVTYKDGKYCGQLVNGRKEGKGIYCWNDGV